MSDSKKSPDDSADKKRNLPSWMSSRNDAGENEENNGEKPKQAKDHGRAHTGSSFSNKSESSRKSATSCSGTTNFSKFLEGVVFVLSGFVNPERSILRSQALEMGAEYRPDWKSDCTLLVCAFPNTPKFQQVEADGGTIVSKEWISECYSQKRLIDIDSYLMHAGKPWRRSDISLETNQDQKPSPPRNAQKQVERGSHSKLAASAYPKNRPNNPAKECFSPSKVKQWAADDLNRTISWLESQEEKPEPGEIKKIAAEGILTCLQDAIDSLKQKQGVRQITEQWNFIPRVVEELAKLEGGGNDSTSLPKEELYKQAKACKQIYEGELSKLDHNSTGKKKKAITDESTGYDSDETIEMTEEEIDLAYKTVVSKIGK